MIIFPCIPLDAMWNHIEKDKVLNIGVVILKSIRMVGDVLIDGVVQLDLNAKD